MNIREARDFYINHNCSYFLMCTKQYSEYIEYRQLGLPKTQEDGWRRERIRALYKKIAITQDYRLFDSFYEVTVEFRDYENLRLVLDAYKAIKRPEKPEPNVGLAETILGKKNQKSRSGIIYWAYDVGQKAIAILMMDQALQCLDQHNVHKVELEKRIRKAKRLSRKINEELQLNYSEIELKDYSLRKF